MNIITHKRIDQELCGVPLEVGQGFSRVELHTIERMVADESGLIHGGFIFGLADYAAMIAVNHPHVVLGGAEVRFLKPVRVDETIVAEATLNLQENKKRQVTVVVNKDQERVFEGEFTCFVLDHPVLVSSDDLL